MMVRNPPDLPCHTLLDHTAAKIGVNFSMFGSANCITQGMVGHGLLLSESHVQNEGE